MTEFESLKTGLEPVRQRLINHQLYQHLRSPHAMHLFMEHHVFAVWDFMCLLKSLQRSLTCVEVPWRPSSSRSACRMINEIVLGEESDEDGQGGYASHFQLYFSAMEEAGADTRPVASFIEGLNAGASPETAMTAASVSPGARSFVSNTLAVIDSGDLCAIASAFTFGREDLLPEVFEQIVSELNAETEGRFGRFEYYLRRHIELDGDQHGKMAQQLMEDLCGTDADRWQSARSAALHGLEARLALWDAVTERIRSSAVQPSLQTRT